MKADRKYSEASSIWAATDGALVSDAVGLRPYRADEMAQRSIRAETQHRHWITGLTQQDPYAYFIMCEHSGKCFKLQQPTLKVRAFLSHNFDANGFRGNGSLNDLFVRRYLSEDALGGCAQWIVVNIFGSGEGITHVLESRGEFGSFYSNRKRRGTAEKERLILMYL